jgi:RNA polymerase sigma-70 factor (ECF subfamily)
LKAQTGDGRAFTRLIERYHNRLLYYLRRLADNEAAAEDIAQNVWLIVFKKLYTLREADAFPAWLFKIARNQAALTIRHLRKERAALEDMPPADGPEEPFAFPNDAAGIHCALNRLKPEYREVLVLRYFEDLAYEEIADVTHQKVGTVRSRLHYAKQALKQEMEEIRDGS